MKILLFFLVTPEVGVVFSETTAPILIWATSQVTAFGQQRVVRAM